MGAKAELAELLTRENACHVNAKVAVVTYQKGRPHLQHL